VTDTVEITTGDGSLRGLRDGDGMVRLRGVPFAAPPVDERRFAPPAPVDPWDGVRDATRFGAVSVQAGIGAQSALGAAFGLVGEMTTSEDCLTLNVWTPGVDDARRPVLVWIHGGAFRMGSGSSPVYDGAALARRGDVVVVTLNYRLGLLGFLASAELGVANCGLLDQIAALEWVQREIAGLGGDPDQVTIFGESAGGKSVECLLAMPRARGLFHRAIAQSTYGAPTGFEAADARARAIAAHLGLDASEMHELRTVPLERLLEAEMAVASAAGPPAIGAGGGGPVVDGDVLPLEPIDAVRQGLAADVPLVVGTTLDEARLFAAMAPVAEGIDEGDLGPRLLELMGAAPDDAGLAERAVAAYRAARHELGRADDPAGLVVDALTDRMFRQHCLRLAEASAERGVDTYMYLFTWESPAAGGTLGACHAVDLGFVFGSLDVIARFCGDGPDAEALAGRVQDAWLAMARTGAPATGSLPHWPVYDLSRRATMRLGPDPAVIDAPLEGIRRVWTEVSSAR
jgi:para-nitrobenzyl esterase